MLRITLQDIMQSQSLVDYNVKLAILLPLKIIAKDTIKIRLNLIYYRDRGGEKYPSNSTLKVCSSAENILKPLLKNQV